MPGIENEKEVIARHNSTNEEKSIDHIQQPDREITLTDKLNKKLLESFLQRLNGGSFPVNSEIFV